MKKEEKKAKEREYIAEKVREYLQTKTITKLDARTCTDPMFWDESVLYQNLSENTLFIEPE